MGGWEGGGDGPRKESGTSREEGLRDGCRAREAGGRVREEGGRGEPRGEG